MKEDHMKTLIVFYSFSGRTRATAQELAAKEAYDVTEIKTVKNVGKLKAYTAGIFASIKGKTWPILPIDAELAGYDRLVLLAPVWAGNPPPAFNAFLQQLPSGKTIAIKMVSASGKSDCRERLEAIITKKGCTLESVTDIQAQR